MNTYLTFNSDGTLFQKCTISEIPNDGKEYIDVLTLNFEPDIYNNIYTLVNNEIQSSPIPEIVISEDEKLANVRMIRNEILNDSDWTQVPDSPANSSEWATYRQGLRDITEGIDLSNVAWPTPPV